MDVVIQRLLMKTVHHKYWSASLKRFVQAQSDQSTKRRKSQRENAAMNDDSIDDDLIPVNPGRRLKFFSPTISFSLILHHLELAHLPIVITHIFQNTRNLHLRPLSLFYFDPNIYPFRSHHDTRPQNRISTKCLGPKLSCSPATS